MKLFLKFLLFLCSTPFALYAMDNEPWFTGPIIALDGHTTKLGHYNVEVYGFYTEDIGRYNRHWKLVSSTSSFSTQVNPLFSYGLSDSVDIQYSVPYAFNSEKGRRARHIGDIYAMVGYQALLQKDSLWRPSLRVTIQETFPTGRFQNLNPLDSGTDGTGLGSYQTALGLNFQHLFLIAQKFYLRQRVSLGYVYAHPINIRGHSSYGGNFETYGNIKPGDLWSADMSEEFAITRHWVAVMEAYYFSRQATRFRGNPGFNRQGQPLPIGTPSNAEWSLAPAVEYNFSSHLGVIAGTWFAVKGKNVANFTSFVVAVNYYH